MDKFKSTVATVLDFMNDNHYSQHSLRLYQKIFDNLAEYLTTNKLSYSPELGEKLLESGSHIPFGIKGATLHAAVVNKINAVYRTGSVAGALISSRKPYSALKLNETFETCLIYFTESIRSLFTETQMENITRRCRLFLKYLQYIGKKTLSAIDYQVISDYHFEELSHLKPASRMMEEGAIRRFLQFFADEKKIKYSLSMYMYALETDSFIDISSIDETDSQSIKDSYCHLITSIDYHKMIDELIVEGQKAGYVFSYHKELQRSLRYFELFLDFYKINYSSKINELWLNSKRTKEIFNGSSWYTARRALFLLNEYAKTGKPDFTLVLPHGITGMSELPEWMLKPLTEYTKIRTKEKLDDDTVKNDIYSLLRLFRFLLHKKVTSFTEVTVEMLVDFNVYDEHFSSEGKNACNARIRRFFTYLYREKIILNYYLIQVLGYSSVRTENVITILTDDEKEAIGCYIKNAVTPLQLQDSAVILLGTEMGIRGCDIVRIKLTDISFKHKTIRFMQDKTDVEVQLAMPVSVGNAIFKYLKLGRPKCIDSELLFISLKAPYRPLTRNICNGALKRILPQRNVKGSGFHVTRKTFSTSKLRNGIAPEMISSVLGQCSVKSLTPYLSLDDERLSMCPLSLEDLNIAWKGDFL